MSPSKPRPDPYVWSGIPDVLGYIRGARIWRIKEVDGAPRLLSVVRDLIWQPGEQVAAECLPYGPGGSVITPPGMPFFLPCKESPQPKCRCGVWGTYDYQATDHYRHWKPGRDPNQTLGGRLVGGGIEAHGRVVEGRIGFRAQFARPIVLSYSGGWGKKWRTLVERVAIAYDLPIADQMPTFDKPE